MRARRTQPCSVQVRIDPIPPKGLPRLQTCHRQRSSHTVGPTSDKRVHVVVIRPIETKSSIERCTTWGISTGGVRVISWSRIRSTTVPSAVNTLRSSVAERSWHTAMLMGHPPQIITCGGEHVPQGCFEGLTPVQVPMVVQELV